MSRDLKAATIYYLAYNDESSMIFVTGQGSERSITRTKFGVRFMYDGIAGLDLSCAGVADAFSEHPSSGSPLTLVVELEEWDSEAVQIQGAIDKAITNLCRSMYRVNSSHDWTIRALDELVQLSYVDISVPKLKAAEKLARDSYKASGREAFKEASELR